MKVSLLVFVCCVGPLFGVSPVDPLATKETVCLYSNIYNLKSSKNVIFGHHFSNLEGQNFYDSTGNKNESDVLTDVGEFPGYIEYALDKYLQDNKNFTNHIRNAVAKGNMVGWYWLSQNPVTGGSCTDTSGDPVTQLMPGGSANDKWNSLLDRAANFIKSVQFPGKALGTTIPMIFRLFHENLGNWYWWGQNYCTREQYMAAYNYTRWYLVEKNNLHNLLFVYAPNKPSTYYSNSADYGNDRYPGDTNIDITSFDSYGTDDFSSELVNDISLVNEFASNHNKVSAIAEFGQSDGIQTTTLTDWFMQVAYNPIWGNKSDNTLPHFSYMLTWSNFNTGKYWIPIEGEPNFDSFVQFYKQNETFFEYDTKLLDLYNC